MEVQIMDKLQNNLNTHDPYKNEKLKKINGGEE